MKVVVYQGIDNVPQEAWNAVAASHPFSSWQWCKFNEVIRHPLTAYYLVAMTDDDRLVGGVQFSVNPREFIPTGNHFARHIIEAYVKKRPFIMSRAGAVSGFKGLYLPEDTSLHPEFISRITEIGRDIAHDHTGSFVIFSYLEDELDATGWNGAVRLSDYMAPSTRLLLQWETYDQYLRHLTKKRRKNIRRNTEAASELGITFECSSQVTDIDRAEELIRNIHRYYDVQGNVIVRPILENAHLIPDYVWLTAHHEGQLVGCEILTYDKHSGVAAPLIYGRDYEVDYVYFAMYYREIQLAIEKYKAKVLIGDSEAYAAKRRIGFEKEQRNNIRFYPVSPLSRLMFTVFKNVVD